jgi:hypothetical protein
MQWVSWALSLGVNHLGHEADHSLPSSAEVKYDGAIPPLPMHLHCMGCLLIKHKDNFTFTFNICKNFPDFDVYVYIDRFLCYLIYSIYTPNH